MAHQVENMFSVRETPWHGLGEVLEDAPTIGEAIGLAGLDWAVETVDLFTGDGVDASGLVRVNRRTDTGALLGAVGPRYVPLQNQRAFDWFQPFVDSGAAELHTAGSLCDGQKVWVLAKINRSNGEVVAGDEIAKFILLSNSHDGKNAVRVGFTPIRVVCANTMAAAHNCDASKLLRVRHTRKMELALDTVRDIMDLLNADFEATTEQYQFLASRYVRRGDLEKYVKICLGMDKKADEDIKTRGKNIIEDVVARFNAPRQRLPGIEGTWWAAYNAYNEYLNYKAGRTSNNRMDKLWFGTGATDNAKALQTATNFANAV